MYSKHEKFLFILWMLFEFISAKTRSPQRREEESVMHVVAKSAKKGRRDAEDAEVAGLVWWYR
jgi:hypothetical protein